jgi:hypothetical protein
MLGSFRRLPREEFGLSTHAYDDLAASVDRWRNEVAITQRPIESRDPEAEL